MSNWVPRYDDIRTIAETKMDNGCTVKTVSFWNEGIEVYKTSVTHPDTRDVESYLYQSTQEAITHHRYLAGGTTYLDGGDKKPFPDRIKQVMWEIDDDDDKDEPLR